MTAGLITPFAILGPPAAASVNPCGLGYTLRITAPIDMLYSFQHQTGKRVQPIGTIKGYGLGMPNAPSSASTPAGSASPKSRNSGCH